MNSTAEKIPVLLLLIVSLLCRSSLISAQGQKYKVLVLTERGGQHEGFVLAALEWLETAAGDKNFEMTVINNTLQLNDGYLGQYRVFIQLNYPPYTWGDTAMAAFANYIEQGRGGWIGFHHATLLGEFDGYPMWDWFSGFMGGIRFKNYIAETASGTVNVEDHDHPVMRGIPASFTVPKEEWYTFDLSPRPGMHVLANVDEESYDPPSEIKMGDHPVVWVNEHMKSRNVYFLMGHHGDLFKVAEFTRMFSNAIDWAAGK